MGFRYTVTARFTEKSTADEWVAWLKAGHCRDVLNGGATRAQIVRLTPSDDLAFEVRYDFPNEAVFRRYQSDYAPHLIEEGLSLFPSTRGIEYARTSGSVLHEEGSA